MIFSTSQREAKFSEPLVEKQVDLQEIHRVLLIQQPLAERVGYVEASENLDEPTSLTSRVAVDRRIRAGLPFLVVVVS